MTVTRRCDRLGTACNMDAIAAIATRIAPDVRTWSYNHYATNVTKSFRVQPLKNKFIDLTQFEHDPFQHKQKIEHKPLWKRHMQQAAEHAINTTCPDWKNEKKQFDTYNAIQKAKDTALKNYRRQEWLFEKARAWLQSLARKAETPVVNPGYRILFAGEVLDPTKIIRIAHYIFLRGTGEIEAFVRYLERNEKNKKNGKNNISKLIDAYKGHMENCK